MWVFQAGAVVSACMWCGSACRSSFNPLFANLNPVDFKLPQKGFKVLAPLAVPCSLTRVADLSQQPGVWGGPRPVEGKQAHLDFFAGTMTWLVGQGCAHFCHRSGDGLQLLDSSACCMFACPLLAGWCTAQCFGDATLCQVVDTVCGLWSSMPLSFTSLIACPPVDEQTAACCLIVVLRGSGQLEGRSCEHAACLAWVC